MLPRPAPGRFYVVATPIGNLEDITLRALRVLRDVRVIAAEDTRRTAKLLAHAGIQTPMVSVHAHNEVARLPVLIDRLRQGEDIALVTDAGTPLLSDPGDHLIRAALDDGLPVEAVPGASAVLAARLSRCPSLVIRSNSSTRRSSSTSSWASSGEDGSTMQVNSPIGAAMLGCCTTSARLPRISSSCFFVISRQTATCRCAPRTSLTSSSVWRMR